MGEIRKNNEKVLDIKPEDLPLQDFLTSRYSMTARVQIQPTYQKAKEENIPFFNLTAACILMAINEIPELKWRIKDNKVIEYDYINAVTPILQEDHSIREIEIMPPSCFHSLREWNDYVQNKKTHIEENQYQVAPSLRDTAPIANFSCIRWVDFDSVTNIIASPHQIMPVIAWGKMVEGRVPLSITISHMFIFGWHLGQFYQKVEDYLTHPEKLFVSPSP